MSEFAILIITVLSISAVHTFSGPDHYLPFIVLSRSKKWSLKKTLFWTALCGIAHVLSSVILGILGIFLGWSIKKTFHIESIRGGFAAWMLLSFGILYLLYALYNLNKNKIHKHFDASEDGEIFVFEHQHKQNTRPNKRYKVTPWVLFFIFASGPSEPMIPLIIYPSINYSLNKVGILIGFYTFSTVLTMLAMVVVGYYSAHIFTFKNYEKYLETISAAIIVICGIGMVFLEW
jgi:sulfite exporter TauE/SafE